MNKLQKEIEAISKAEDKIKIRLMEELTSFPQNPHINKLSGDAFSISSATIFADKNNTLSPEYYDFKRQYEVLSGIISKAKLSSLPDILNKIIENKSAVIGSKPYTFKFHDEVISNLKKIVNEKA